MGSLWLQHSNYSVSSVLSAFFTFYRAKALPVLQFVMSFCIYYYVIGSYLKTPYYAEMKEYFKSYK
ncbi:hypothetical protein BES09_13030 [Elizabethkingia meningoseptica]|nr:hypothetical protein BES09_13030 [Elizabethkingia meningoseptica]